MGIHFKVFKGTPNGAIIEADGYREPGPTEVIVKISHCGVCGSDEHCVGNDQGLGHEGIGTIVEVGTSVHEVSEFRVGDRVGMGWFHKFCGRCKACVSGCQNQCAAAASYGNANLDQGCFGTAVAWDISALFKVPDEISYEDAAPLMCAGATVWNAIDKSGVRGSGRIGIVGVGGLGHLAIQYISKMGIQAIAFSGTESKKQQALDFGASEFHLTRGVTKLDGVEKLDALLITSSFNPDLSLYFPALAAGGKVFPLTISTEALQIEPLTMNLFNFQVIGSGLSPISGFRDMLAFSAKHGIRPQIEKFPMTQAGVIEAMQKLRNGNMRYRGVLVAP